MEPVKELVPVVNPCTESGSKGCASSGTWHSCATVAHVCLDSLADISDGWFALQVGHVVLQGLELGCSFDTG